MPGLRRLKTALPLLDLHRNDNATSAQPTDGEASMRLSDGPLILCLVLAGCNSPDLKVNQAKLGDADMLIARPYSRILTERSRPLLGAFKDGGNQPVLCTEPSPDVAIALARSAQLTGSGSAPSGPSASLNGSFNTSETASSQPGRTAGVVALRDGLYAACQAYVNGVIGHDSYGLILSQYGKILVSLVGPSNTAGSDAKSPGPSTPNLPAAGGLALTIAGGSISSPAGVAGKSPAPVNSPQSPSATSAALSLVEPLLIACIEEYDETRIMPRDVSGKPIHNLLLEQSCSGLMTNIVSALARQATPQINANAKPAIRR